MSTHLRVYWVTTCLLVLSTAAAGAVDEAAVERAITRGVDSLKQSQTKEGLWTRAQNGTVGATALAGLALLECGVSADDPSIQKAVQALREGSIPLTDTYSIALCILFFDRLGNAVDVPLIESLTVRLLAGQTADGGWTYECPNIGDAEVRRLKSLIKVQNGHDQERTSTAKRRRVKDLPPPIQQQLHLVERFNPGAAAAVTSDNSNTQFATLALWVGHRHGLPVEKALARLEARFRNTQKADGGWDYRAGLATSPAMICAGLLGLAVAYGITNEAVLGGQEAKESKDDGVKTGKDPRSLKPKAARDPARDHSVRAALLALGAAIHEPIGLQPVTGGVQIINHRPATGFPNYYFLWSLERVAVVYGLETIGNRDWYTWGAEFALARQQSDGGWSGDYPEGGVDTSFALLFLRRSNLAQDLTISLRGKVHDPGEVTLRAGGVGAGELAKQHTRSKEGDGDKTGGDLNPKLLPPDPLAPRDGRSSRTAQGAAMDRESARLSAELVQAGPAQRDALLDKLKESKGVVHTQALAAAIPQLTGASKTKARDALAERIARMTTATLKDKLQDGDPEIRRAAALACAMKEEKNLIPNLLQLLADSELPVARAAHVALKALSGQDFGPDAVASPAERATAITAWKSWWTKHKGSLPATAPPSADDAFSDKDKLQGAWVLTALEREGKPVPKAQLGNLRVKMIFSDHHVTFEYPDHTERGTYTLENTQEVKTIDVVTELDTSRGIYRLEGDSLKICGVPNGEERPTEFATRPGTKQVLFVLQRQKP
jgi:uncharacterized protein (TIGR03067 family)